MAVARASLRQKLCSAPPSLFFAVASTSSRSWLSTSSLRPAEPRRPMILENCKHFMKNDGTLHTTPANVDFLREHDLEHDAAVALPLKGNAGTGKVCTDFGVVLRYTPRHLIHPFDLHCFDPRGHPLMTAQRQRYAEKARTQPLWFITTCTNESKATVRLTAQKRLRASLCLALEGQGYDRYGNGKGKQLGGTVWIHVRDPLKAVSQPMKNFGEPIVKHLLRLRDQPSRESEQRKNSAPGRQSNSPVDQTLKPRPQIQKPENKGPRPKGQSKKPSGKPSEHKDFLHKFQGRR